MNIAVQDRWDTKFLISADDIPALLAALENEYEVLEINGKRISDYTNLYLDTDDWQIFHQHRMGRLPRFKIRYRTYEHSGISFFEVKRKNQNGKTVKERWAVENTPSMQQNDFLLEAGFSREVSDRFKIKLKNKFQRIALANIAAGERITIDWNLQFENTENIFCPQQLAVVELKQPRQSVNGHLFRFMRNRNIVPVQFSKYCIGAVYLNKTLPSTFFTPALRQMHLLSPFNKPEIV